MVCKGSLLKVHRSCLLGWLGPELTEGMPKWPRGCVSTTSHSTTLLLLPPAAAMMRASLWGWNLICQVSDGGVSITAFVLLSCSDAHMKMIGFAQASISPTSVVEQQKGPFA